MGHFKPRADLSKQKRGEQADLENGRAKKDKDSEFRGTAKGESDKTDDAPAKKKWSKEDWAARNKRKAGGATGTNPNENRAMGKRKRSRIEVIRREVSGVGRI